MDIRDIYLTPILPATAAYLTPTPNRGSRVYNLSAANQNLLLKSVQSGYIRSVRAPFSRIEFDLNLRRERYYGAGEHQMKYNLHIFGSS